MVSDLDFGLDMSKMYLIDLWPWPWPWPVKNDLWLHPEPHLLTSATHSVNAMRIMLDICEKFAVDFDIKFNGSKW